MKCACGCTDERACEGGCFWVYKDEATGKGLCSKCVFEHIYKAAAGAPEDVRFDIAELLIKLADRIHPEYDAQCAQDEAIEAAFEAQAFEAGANGLEATNPSELLDDRPTLWLPEDPL